MRETVLKTIDGVQYEISQMSATKGLRWFKRLQDVFLPSIGRALGALGDAKIDGDQLGKALETLSKTCSEAQYEEWVKDLLQGVLRDHRAINFEADFQGRILHLHKVLGAILEVNFSDFLDELKGKGGNFLGKLRAPLNP